MSRDSKRTVGGLFPSFCKISALMLLTLGSAALLALAGQRAGLYGFELALSTVVFSALGTLAWLVWLHVRSLNRIETTLRESETRYGAIVESALDAIVTIDHEGRVVEFNPAAEKLFGYKRSEIIGRVLGDCLIPPSLRQTHRLELERFLATDQSRVLGKRVEMPALHAGGQEFPVELAITSISKIGLPTFTAFIRDLREQKAQEAMRQKSAALEEENRRAQEANRLKGEFLANLSHEIRTPLNAVIGFSQLLIDEKAGPLNERQRDYLTDVLTGGQYLLQLLNDILDLSKIEAGKLELHVEIFSIRQAVDEVCAIMRPMAAKKNVAITTAMPFAENVMLDQRKFKQILYNLLSNAVKFSHDNGEVNLIVARDVQGHIRVQVKDNGIGIKAEDMPRLFREFEQLDCGNVRRYQGTGLGLALTKKIVELQQGSISVQSELGKGSTFTVSVPRELKRQPPAFNGGRRRVLRF